MSNAPGPRLGQVMSRRTVGGRGEGERVPAGGGEAEPDPSGGCGGGRADEGPGGGRGDGLGGQDAGAAGLVEDGAGGGVVPELPTSSSQRTAARAGHSAEERVL